MKEHESNKAYTPTEDPYFIEAEKVMNTTFLGNADHQIPTAVFGAERVITIAMIAPALIFFKLRLVGATCRKAGYSNTRQS